jgi:hypothetical protein
MGVMFCTWCIGLAPDLARSRHVWECAHHFPKDHRVWSLRDKFRDPEFFTEDERLLGINLAVMI